MTKNGEIEVVFKKVYFRWFSFVRKTCCGFLILLNYLEIIPSVLGSESCASGNGFFRGCWDHGRSRRR